MLRKFLQSLKGTGSGSDSQAKAKNITVTAVKVSDETKAAEKKYPYLSALIGIMRYPDANSDESAKPMISAYEGMAQINEAYGYSDPNNAGLQADITRFLANGSNQEFTALVGVPGSQDGWEYGCPTESQIQGLLSEILSELERRNR